MSNKVTEYITSMAESLYGNSAEKQASNVGVDSLDYLGVGTARRTNEFNAQQAQLNREWLEKMSNSAHQREVADLKKAGLNPVLSAGGTGASTPSSSSASGVQSNSKGLSDILHSAGSLISSIGKLLS